MKDYLLRYWGVNSSQLPSGCQSKSALVFVLFEIVSFVFVPTDWHAVYSGRGSGHSNCWQRDSASHVSKFSLVCFISGLVNIQPDLQLTARYLEIAIIIIVIERGLTDRYGNFLRFACKMMNFAASDANSKLICLDIWSVLDNQIGMSAAGTRV